MDRTILDLISLMLGGAGLFAFMSEFNVPELHETFFNGNPFAVKAATIKGVMTWVFASLALLALIFQVFAEILGIPGRKHGAGVYALIVVVGVACVPFTLFGLKRLGMAIAKRLWWRAAIDAHAEMYEQVVFVVEHQGLRRDQLQSDQHAATPDLQAINLRSAEERLTQIERILELDDSVRGIRERTARLAPLFSRKLHNERR